MDDFDGIGGAIGVAMLALVVIALIIVGGITACRGIDLQVQRAHASAEHWQADQERSRALQEEERTKQEEEKTKREVVEGVTSRMNAVNRLPWLPVAVVLVVLAPFVGYGLGTILGDRYYM